MISIKISRLHSGLLILILISLGQLRLRYYQIKMHLLGSFQKSKEFYLSIVSIPPSGKKKDKSRNDNAKSNENINRLN